MAVAAETHVDCSNLDPALWPKLTWGNESASFEEACGARVSSYRTAGWVVAIKLLFGQQGLKRMPLAKSKGCADVI
jgi:hypothetical protein